MSGSLAAERVSQIFSGARALDEVSFTAHAGEIHAFVGENGASKSTLVRVLSGALSPDEVSSASTVPACGREPHGKRSVSGSRTATRTTTCSRSSPSPRTSRCWPASPTAVAPSSRGSRSGAQPRSCCASTTSTSILRARRARSVRRSARSSGWSAHWRSNPSTSSSMSPPAMELRERHWLFELMRQLRRESLGVIFVSHRLSEVVEFADRATVLRNGGLAGVLTRDVSSTGRSSAASPRASGPCCSSPWSTTLPAGRSRRPISATCCRGRQRSPRWSSGTSRRPRRSCRAG